jgi:hypothetical protein
VTHYKCHKKKHYANKSLEKRKCKGKQPWKLFVGSVDTSVGMDAIPLLLLVCMPTMEHLDI